MILAAHRRLAKGNGEGRYLHNDNFALFNDSSRFINVELSLLDYNTTMKICNDIFSSFGVRIQEQSVFDNIYEMSGGNGLYIHELSKAIAIQESKLQDKGNDQQHIFQINRVEEVICHRFDQFDPICQLLLKLASVACAGGAPFTASLLSHMLADDSAAYNNLFSCIWSKQNHDLTFITSMLSLILEKNEFIRISQANCKMQDGFDVDTLDSLFGEQAFLLSNKNYVHPSISAAISIDEDITEEEIVHGLDSLQLEQNAEYSFEFKVLLEQLTIYDLMLEEQKMALHERVAYYLNDRIPKSLDDVTSAALFAEQGFHWQQARQFKDAMRCFNTAGLILEKAGSFPDAFEQFHAAMRMFHLLRQDCGIGEQSMIDDGREITSKLFKRSSLVLPTGSDVHRPRSTTISENSEFSFKHLLKSDLQRIFHSDTESLAVAFSIVVKVAQCSVVLENDQTFCAKCFEEVVNFTLLLWPDGITPNLSTAVSPNLSPLPVQPPNRFSNLLLDIFPALNSMVSSFRNHKLGDDEAHTKEVAVCKLFLHLAETLHADCLNECQDSKYISNVVAHLIWGLVLQRELYTLSDFSNYEEVLDFSDRILALYDHSAHSAVISDHYGIDLVPQVLASTLFITIVQSDLVSTKRYFHAMVEMLPNLRSINLAATVTLPLISVASFLNYSSEVQELLLHYTMMEQENDHERQRFAEDQSSKKASVFSDGVAALRSSVRFQNDSVGAKLSTKQADIALADSNKSAEFTETIIFKEYTPLILLWFVRSTDSQTSFPAIDMSSLASPTSPQRGPWFTRLQSRSNSGQTIGSTYSSSLMELLKRRIRELRDANKRVLRKGYLFPIDSVRPAKYSVLASLGIEVEYLCGSICYHKFNESKSFPLMSSQSTKTGSLASSSVVSHSKSHFLGTQRYHFDHESRGRYLEMALDYIDSFFSREHVLSHHYFFRLMVNSILKAKTLVALAEAIKHEPIIDRGKDFGLDARSLLMSESVESDSGKMTMSQESESQRFSKAREIQILQWNQEAKECLSECARVGSEHHCTMLQIAAGHCLLELSLDIETGSRLISSALDNLQTTQLSDSFEGIVRQKDNSNDESGVSSNNNFTLLRQLFPSLKDFLM